MRTYVVARTRTSEEVERLSEIPPVMQAPGDHRQVPDPDCGVVRAFLKDRASLVLRELSPPLRLPDRDERRPGRRWATERLLPAGEGLMFLGGRIPLMASNAPKHPDRVPQQPRPGTLDHGDMRGIRKRLTCDGIDTVHRPRSCVAAHKACLERPTDAAARLLERRF